MLQADIQRISVIFQLERALASALGGKKQDVPHLMLLREELLIFSTRAPRSPLQQEVLDAFLRTLETALRRSRH